MTSTQTKELTERLGSAESALDWADALEDHCEGLDHGFSDCLDSDHSCCFVSRSETLVVVFEHIERARGVVSNPLPLAWNISEENDWSYLVFTAMRKSSFLTTGVLELFRELKEQSFFDKFQKIVVYGSGDTALAASSFAALCGNATVILVQPTADFDPESISEALPRNEYLKIEGHEISAFPEALEHADNLILLDNADRVEALDLGNLAGKCNVYPVKCWNLGAVAERTLRHINALPPVFDMAVNDPTNTAPFFRAFRARMNFRPYLRTLLTKSLARPDKALTIRLCVEARKRVGGKVFRETYNKLTALKESA